MTTAIPARIHSGIVMTFGDSCGWPSPRYSPKNVSHTARVMYAAVMKAVMHPKISISQ